MTSEQEKWQTYVARAEKPADRMLSSQMIDKSELDLKTLKVDPTLMTQRETRCRAVFKVRYGERGKQQYQRCINLAYLDAYIDPDEQYGSEGRVALCWVHAGACIRGNLRISR